MNPEVKMLIERHGLSIEEFFDAKGSPVNHVKANMKKAGFQWAYNSTACNNGGHTTRDRSGHCIVCNPASIAFQKRNSVQGYIYIACSLSKGYTKIGMTTEILETRIQKLNSREVGATNDWQPVVEIRCSEPNRLELLVHSKLERYKALGLYDNMDTENREIFRCGISKMLAVLDEAQAQLEMGQIRRRNYTTNLEQFNFKNIRRI